MKPSFAAAVLLVAVLSGCGSDPSPAPATPSTPVAAPTSGSTSGGNTASPMVANLCSPGKDMGCGTPDAECSTNRLGKQFVLDGVVYTCGGEKPYKWRR
ncbi:hypothetical protein AB0K00_17495 [Dactylosporangium sp. NPDC049525]|uniref:hypothetical protein n=1 Tax=Dactylosporangium sp. NPDC049525 TaxID=3154730 RepID=UPI00341A07B7